MTKLVLSLPASSLHFPARTAQPLEADTPHSHTRRRYLGRLSIAMLMGQTKFRFHTASGDRQEARRVEPVVLVAEGATETKGAEPPNLILRSPFHLHQVPIRRSCFSSCRSPRSAHTQSGPFLLGRHPVALRYSSRLLHTAMLCCFSLISALCSVVGTADAAHVASVLIGAFLAVVRSARARPRCVHGVFYRRVRRTTPTSVSIGPSSIIIGACRVPELCAPALSSLPVALWDYFARGSAPQT